MPNNPGHLHFTFVFLKCFFLNQSSNSLQLLWSLYFTGNFFTSQTFVTVMIRNKETKKYVKSLRQNSVLIVCIVSITYYSQCTKMSGRRTCGSLQWLVKEISKKNQAAIHTVTISRIMYVLHSTLCNKYLGFVSKSTMEIILWN